MANTVRLVDRIDVIAAMRELCTGDLAHALMLWGVGGQGKSTMLSHFRGNVVLEFGYPCEIIDLEVFVSGGVHREVDLAQQLLTLVARCCESWLGRRLRRYWGLVDVANQEIRDFVRSTPSLSINQKASSHGRISDVSIHLDAGLGHRYSLLKVEQRNMLTRGLMEDIANSTPPAELTQRAFLCFDTTERLHFLDGNVLDSAATAPGGGIQHWLTTQLILELSYVWPGLRFVLAGRERLNLPVDTKSIELTEWEETYTQEIARSSGIGGNTASKVHSIALGHPLWTTVLIDALLSSDRRLPNTDELISRNLRTEPRARWVSRTLLGRIPERDKRAVIAAAVPRRITKAVLAELLSEHSEDTAWYERICSYSFIQLRHEANGRYEVYMHTLVRSAILSHVHSELPDMIQHFNVAAIHFFTEHNDAMEVLYHRISLGDQAAMNTWSEEIDAALMRYEFDRALQLIEVAEVADPPTGITFDIARRMKAKSSVAAGRIAFFQMRLTEAENQLTHGCGQAEEIGEYQLAGKAQLWLAELHHRQLNLVGASDASEAAKSLFERAGDPVGVASVLHIQGHLHLARMDTGSALLSASRSLDLFRSLGDNLGQARALELLAHVKCGKAELVAALTDVREAGRLYEDQHDLRGIAAVNGMLADISLLLGDMSGALAAASRALEIYTETGEAFKEAGAVHIFGRIKLATNRFAEAEADALREIDFHRRTMNKLGLANAIHLLASVRLEQDHLHEAQELALESQELYSVVENPLGMAHSLALLAEIALRSDRLFDRQDELERALAIYRRLSNTLGEAESLLLFAEAHHQSQSYAEALETSRLALDAFTRLGTHPGIARASLLRARVFASLQRVEDATAEARRARQEFEYCEDARGEGAAAQLITALDTPSL